jgi:hypothetical protein
MASHDKLALVRVERDTHAALHKAAEAAGHTITEEVRQRLAASFERDRDPKLTELQRRTSELVDLVQSWGVGKKWHSDPFAFKVLRAGMLALLEATPRPPGEVVAPTGSMLSPNDDPETLGRTLARVVLEKEKALARGQGFEVDFRTK